jgi:hypothetical protein
MQVATGNMRRPRRLTKLWIALAVIIIAAIIVAIALTTGGDGGGGRY